MLKLEAYEFKEAQMETNSSHFTKATYFCVFGLSCLIYIPYERIKT